MTALHDPPEAENGRMPEDAEQSRKGLEFRGGVMMNQCPGAAGIRTPRLEIRACPGCGEEIEVFSNEASAKCLKCGQVIYNDLV